MKELRELARTMALCKAYELAKEACEVCGLPGEIQVEIDFCTLAFRCGSCPMPDGASGHRDLPARKAIQRLIRIASGEGT